MADDGDREKVSNVEFASETAGSNPDAGSSDPRSTTSDAARPPEGTLSSTEVPPSHPNRPPARSTSNVDFSEGQHQRARRLWVSPATGRPNPPENRRAPETKPYPKGTGCSYKSSTFRCPKPGSVSLGSGVRNPRLMRDDSQTGSSGPAAKTMPATSMTVFGEMEYSSRAPVSGENSMSRAGTAFGPQPRLMKTSRVSMVSPGIDEFITDVGSRPRQPEHRTGDAGNRTDETVTRVSSVGQCSEITLRQTLERTEPAMITDSKPAKVNSSIDPRTRKRKARSMFSNSSSEVAKATEEPENSGKCVHSEAESGSSVRFISESNMLHRELDEVFQEPETRTGGSGSTRSAVGQNPKKSKTISESGSMSPKLVTSRSKAVHSSGTRVVESKTDPEMPRKEAANPIHLPEILEFMSPLARLESETLEPGAPTPSLRSELEGSAGESAFSASKDRRVVIQLPEPDLGTPPSRPRHRESDTRLTSSLTGIVRADIAKYRNTNDARRAFHQNHTPSVKVRPAGVETATVRRPQEDPVTNRSVPKAATPAPSKRSPLGSEVRRPTTGALGAKEFRTFSSAAETRPVVHETDQISRVVSTELELNEITAEVRSTGPETQTTSPEIEAALGIDEPEVPVSEVSGSDFLGGPLHPAEEPQAESLATIGTIALNQRLEGHELGRTPLAGGLEPTQPTADTAAAKTSVASKSSFQDSAPTPPPPPSLSTVESRCSVSLAARTHNQDIQELTSGMKPTLPNPFGEMRNPRSKQVTSEGRTQRRWDESTHPVGVGVELFDEEFQIVRNAARDPQKKNLNVAAVAAALQSECATAECRPTSQPIEHSNSIASLMKKLMKYKDELMKSRAKSLDPKRDLLKPTIGTEHSKSRPLSHQFQLNCPGQEPDIFRAPMCPDEKVARFRYKQGVWESSRRDDAEDSGGQSTPSTAAVGVPRPPTNPPDLQTRHTSIPEEQPPPERTESVEPNSLSVIVAKTLDVQCEVGCPSPLLIQPKSGRIVPVPAPGVPGAPNECVGGKSVSSKGKSTFAKTLRSDLNSVLTNFKRQTAKLFRSSASSKRGSSAGARAVEPHEISNSSPKDLKAAVVALEQKSSMFQTESESLRRFESDFTKSGSQRTSAMNRAAEFREDFGDSDPVDFRLEPGPSAAETKISGGSACLFDAMRTSMKQSSEETESDEQSASSNSWYPNSEDKQSKSGKKTEDSNADSSVDGRLITGRKKEGYNSEEDLEVNNLRTNDPEPEADGTGASAETENNSDESQSVSASGRPTWIRRVVGGPKRANHAAVFYGKRIFVFGGYRHACNNYRMRPMDVFVFNTETLRWMTNKIFQTYLPFSTSDYRLNTYGHTAVRLNNKVYIHGGTTYYRSYTALYEYDLDQNEFTLIETEGVHEGRFEWSRRFPQVADGHTACIIKGSMYVLGGHDSYRNRASKSFWALDLETKKWREVEPEKGRTPRVDHHVVWALDSRMYVYGGRTAGHLDQSDYNDEEYCPMMYFDVDTNCWHESEEHGDVPLGRSGHSGFLRNRKLYVFGGYNRNEDKHFDDMFVYNPETFTWSHVDCEAIAATPRCRRRHISVISDEGDECYIYGGATPMSDADKHFNRTFRSFQECPPSFLCRNGERELLIKTGAEDMMELGDVVILDFRGPASKNEDFADIARAILRRSIVYMTEEKVREFGKQVDEQLDETEPEFQDMVKSSVTGLLYHTIRILTYKLCVEAQSAGKKIEPQLLTDLRDVAERVSENDSMPFRPAVKNELCSLVEKYQPGSGNSSDDECVSLSPNALTLIKMVANGASRKEIFPALKKLQFFVLKDCFATSNDDLISLAQSLWLSRGVYGRDFEKIRYDSLKNQFSDSENASYQNAQVPGDESGENESRPEGDDSEDTGA